MEISLKDGFRFSTDFSSGRSRDIICAIHNVSFYQQLMRDMREAILNGHFVDYKQSFLNEYARS